MATLTLHVLVKDEVPIVSRVYHLITLWFLPRLRIRVMGFILFGAQKNASYLRFRIPITRSRKRERMKTCEVGWQCC